MQFRAAQHEDINFITLLVGATADGLEVMDHDGSWIAVEGKHDHIIVDTGRYDSKHHQRPL